MGLKDKIVDDENVRRKVGGYNSGLENLIYILNFI